MVTLQDVMNVTDILGDIMMVIVAMDFIELISLYSTSTNAQGPG